MSLDNSITSVNQIIRGLIKDLQKTDGRDLFEYDSDNTFNLSEPFVSASSIVVFQNGSALSASDWSYDSSNNIVTISFVSSGGSLTKDDLILITYDYFKKYSDTEIQGYIVSALSYFAENRYKKIFEVNSNDKIVACNDHDPTIRELYFISIISSILIDPMNVEIKTPDFSITAQRDKSDRDQISEAFTRYQRFVGTLDFNERDYDNNKRH